MRIIFNAYDWNRIVKLCTPFCSTDPRHQDLHSVMIDAQNNKCTANALDGYKACVLHLPCRMSDEIQQVHWRLPRSLHKTKGSSVVVSDEERPGFIDIHYEDQEPDGEKIEQLSITLNWQSYMDAIRKREGDIQIAVNPNKLIDALMPFKDRESLVRPVILYIRKPHEAIYLRQANREPDAEAVCLPCRVWPMDKD